ncbi:MAG: hypothetical protein P4M14_09650 [Gammaproteobacteria bacterium]|nr:hypothetical protein [Gammaproteobacteria bacterium]
MTHKRYIPLPPRSKLFLHLAKSFFIGVLAIIIALGVGMAGYHHFEAMSWVDAFLNASMILSGMGPIGNLQSAGGKIFAGFYALFSGLTFILIIGVIMAPIVRYFFHKFHLDIENNDGTS